MFLLLIDRIMYLYQSLIYVSANLGNYLEYIVEDDFSKILTKDFLPHSLQE